CLSREGRVESHPSRRRVSTAVGSAPEHWRRTRGCKSRPTRVVADRSEPSLAGVAVTRGPKRRQGSCGVRKDSPERVNVVEAETVPVVEGHVYAVVTQDGDAPPGSWIASRRVRGTRASGGGESGTSEGRRVMGTLEERIQ